MAASHHSIFNALSNAAFTDPKEIKILMSSDSIDQNGLSLEQ